MNEYFNKPINIKLPSYKMEDVNYRCISEIRDKMIEHKIWDTNTEDSEHIYYWTQKKEWTVTQEIYTILTDKDWSRWLYGSTCEYNIATWIPFVVTIYDPFWDETRAYIDEKIAQFEKLIWNK